MAKSDLIERTSAGPQRALRSQASQCLFMGDRQWQRSWERCRDQFSLQPTLQRTPMYVSGEELRRRRRVMGPIFDMAIGEVDRLHALMPYEVGISIADADGVIVSFV